MAAKVFTNEDAGTCCPDCLKQLRIPRLMDCLHTLCEDCMRNRMVPGGMIACPLCSKDTRVPPAGFAVLPTNWVINAQQRKIFAEQAGSGTMPLCEECIMEEECPAVGMCIECRVFLCETHNRAHKRSRMTRDHSLIEKEEGLSTSDIQSEFSAATVACGVHPHRPILGFCSDCRRTYCVNCRRLSHSDHKLLELDEASVYARQALKQQHLAITESLMPEVSLAIKDVDNTLDSIEDRSQELSTKITTWVQNQVDNLRVLEKQLLGAVSDLREQKEEPLNKQRSSLVNLENKARFATDLSGAALDLENGAELLEMYVCVDSELKSLQSQQEQAEMQDWQGYDFMQFVPNMDLQQCLSSGGIGFIRASSGSPHLSEITGTDCSNLDCKEEVCISVQLRDDSKQPYVPGYDEASLSVSVLNPNDQEVSCTVKHTHSGQHTVRFAAKVCGNYKVHASLHRSAISNSPYDVCVPMHLMCADACQKMVRMSPDRRRAMVETIGDCMVVGDVVFREGCHTWKVRARNVSFSSPLVMAVGAISLPSDGVDCTLYRAWSWRSDGTRVAASRDVVQGCLGKWLDGDELMMELNCTTGTLVCSRVHSSFSDTLHGLPTPVRPFFFFQDQGHCFEIISP